MAQVPGEISQDLDSSKLNLSQVGQSQTDSVKKEKSKEVADSWEDDTESSEDEQDQSQNHEVTHDAGKLRTEPQNHTAVEVDFKNSYPFQSTNSMLLSSSSRGEAPSKRPEKSTVAVNRMIANSLGLRSRLTPEQRAFHQSQVENEKRRRATEKAKKAEEERVKESIWND